MMGRHTYETIKDMLLLVINEFKITTTKIRHIITDGASNFEKAFKKFGPSSKRYLDLCIETQEETNIADGENCDDENCDGDTECDIEDEEIDLNDLFASENGDMYIPNETETIEISNYIEPNDSIEDNEIEEYLPEQLKCYSHTLNLVGVDFEKSLHNKEKKSYDILNAAFMKLKVF